MGVTIGVTVAVGVNVKVGATIVIVGVGVRVLVGADVVVGVWVGVDVLVVADTVDCTVGVSVGLTSPIAIGVGDTAGANKGSGVWVAVTDGVALGNVNVLRSAGSSTCTGVGGGALILCDGGDINPVNTSFLADIITAATTITPTSTTNAPIRQGRWRRRTARQ